MSERKQKTGYLVAQVNRAFELSYDAALRDLGLSLPQARLLQTLRQDDGRTMGELAAAVLVDPPTMTKMIDKLVSTGLVYRAPAVGDRRKVLAYLSETGRIIEAQADVLMAAVDRDFDNLLYGQEEGQLLHLLRRLLKS